MSSPDYILDIAGLKPAGEASSDAQNRFVGRPWLAVKWNCCGVYSRVYRNPAGTAYQGRCPRCGAPVRAAVGAGGTSQRFFEAG